jgi:putative sterol carrier protein
MMFATTERWLQMGNGDYGPMKGMLTRRLRFKGPKWEAMHNMGPFTSFLLLTGSVESDSEACPG